MSENILQTFLIVEPRKWNVLRNNVLSFHSESSDLFKIFTFIYKRKNKLKEISLGEDERLRYFKHISHKRFINLISQINIILENFLIQEHIMNKAHERDLILNKIYNDNGLYKKADRKANKIERDINNNEKLSIRKEKVLASLYHQQYFSDNPAKYKIGKPLLDNLIKNHLNAFKDQSLIYQCELQNMSQLKRWNFTENLNTFIKLNELTAASNISPYLEDLYTLVDKKDIKLLLKLKENLFEQIFDSRSELHVIISLYLYIMSTVMWKSGIYQNKNVYVGIIEYGLEHNIFMVNKKIPKLRYHNLVSSVGKLKSYEWTESFINKWIDFVDTENKDSTYKFAFSTNAFSYGKYDLIYPLSNLTFDTPLDRINAQSLELLTLYIRRKDNYLLVHNFISNFQRTLIRHKSKLSKPNYKGFSNLIKIIQLLIRADFISIKIRIDKNKPLQYGLWLDDEIKKRGLH